MTINSMTGFARSDGVWGQTSWQWEVRSVNGRGLDIRLRLPNGYEAHEGAVRKIVSRKLSRGNVSVNLQVRREAGAGQLHVNTQILEQMLAALALIDQKTTVTPPSAVELLNMKGVMEWRELEEDEQSAAERIDAMMNSLDDAIIGIARTRAAEGAHLAQVIGAQIDDIERLVEEVENAPARSPEAIRKRLREGIARLIDEAGLLDETRLYQEAALLATKLDVEEELKRLHAHIAAARQLLRSREAVGRRFDFLAQEFNREANTLCSKANDTQITRSGLAMKAVIDQMREQVQNIE